MLTSSLAPGVYYETIDATAPIVAGVRTDIAAFIGIAQRGPIDTPVPVDSWRQFVARFGGFIGGGYLAYAVRGFFENEGRRCWIVRVASRDSVGGAFSASASLPSIDVTAGPVWRVAASSPGAWGNGLTVSVVETHRAQTRGFAVPGDPTVLEVSSTAGLRRGTLVRLSQPGSLPRFRVVSAVDAPRSRLVWISERPEQRLPYDEALEIADVSVPVQVASIEYSISVKQYGVPIGVYGGLSLVPEHPSYGPRILSSYDFATAVATTNVADASAVPQLPAPIVLEELRSSFVIDPLRARGAVLAKAAHVAGDARLTLAGGRDGLTVLRVDDFLGEPFSVEDTAEARAAKRRGLRALTDVDEVAVVAVPDIHIHGFRVPPPARPCVPDPCFIEGPVQLPPAPVAAEIPPVFSLDDVFRVQSALVEHCESRRDRIALLDVPFDVAQDDGTGPAAVQAWRSRFDSNFAALYYPWLRVVDPLRDAAALTRLVPPCGHVAGQIAQTDLRLGVHQSAANIPLVWAEDVSRLVDDAVHGLLNDLAINAIRPLPGRGLRILGARLASSDPSWRYVSVRRLVLMVMKAIDLATQWVVFEPNDPATRSKVQLALTVYLTTLWQRGALAGASAASAFFVKCDEENNPPAARDAGQLVADVGLAPTIPWEFIVLRVWRTGNELEITEGVTSNAWGGGR